MIDELLDESTGNDNLELSGEETLEPEQAGEEGEQPEEKQEEQPQEETYTKSQFDEKFSKEINRRYAKLHSEYEELGVDRETIKQLSQMYGIPPKDLMRAVYEQLIQGVPPERRVMQPPPRDPRIDELIREREVEKVEKQWEKEFGVKPGAEDLESITGLQMDLARQGKNLSLLEVYKLATRDTLREKIAKETEKKVLKNLQEKRKGKVLPGSTSKIAGKLDTSKMSLHEVLSFYANELGD